jgi:hypothetical protein
MGGREGVLWNSYPKQHLFHTIGLLPCCENGGCWKSKVLKEGKEGESVCLFPTPTPDDSFVPRCMEMIRPSEVAAAVERCVKST